MDSKPADRTCYLPDRAVIEDGFIVYPYLSGIRRELWCFAEGSSLPAPTIYAGYTSREAALAGLDAYLKASGRRPKASA